MSAPDPETTRVLPACPYIVTGDYTPVQARAYCERLAKSHYENFLVATAFVPRAIRQDFYNLYAYCRIADDLGDESGGPENALPLLDWWETELDLCYAGTPRHPVFQALAETNERFNIPREPYADLLCAFRQDQTVTRYDTYDQLLDYCRNSANPVGRLVLYLCGYSDPVRQAYSDATCTALQLINFWQDVARDYAIGRIYLPLEDMAKYSVTEAQIAAGQFTPAFASLLKMECERAAALFAEGAKLSPMVKRRVRLDIEMFSRGGQEIMHRIETQGYDVLTKRPTVPKWRQLSMLLRRICGR